MKKSFLSLALLFLFCLQVMSQISGKVVDATSGQPLSYVNVFYEGKGVGTATDDDGNFTISAHVGWNKLTFSSVGYQTKVVQVSSNSRALGEIKLMSFELAEVVVKPKRERYSRKNNPAHEFMKRVVAHKKESNLEQNDFYTYNEYEKLTFALNNITSDSLKESNLFKKYPFFKDQVEDCPQTGKRILPLTVDETASQHVFRKSPQSKKKLIKGLKSKGINELFNTGDMLNTILKDMFQSVNVYDDNIRMLQYPINSPISNSGLGFYQYFLMDTLYVEQDKCVHLTFVPNNSQDFGFTGHLYVLADSTYRLKRCILNLPKKTDINYVETMQVEQEYYELPTGEWVQGKDDMWFELNMFGGHFFVRRNTYKMDFDFAEIPQKIFKQKGAEIKDVNAMMRDDEFWRQYRAEADLSQSESNMGSFVNNLYNIKGFKYLLFGLKAFIENFVETGSRKTPSKVDIGPINTMFTSNYIDGFRLRGSAQTTANLHPHWFFKGYGAYGFKDKKFKYMGQVEYSFNKKEYLAREFPKHTLAVSYQYDNVLPSDKFIHTDKDNVFTSFKVTTVDQYNYERNFQINYEHEREYGLKTQFILKHSNYEPCGRLFYRTNAGENALQQAIAEGVYTDENRMFTPYNVHDITVTEATAAIRFAPGETFINTKQRRLPINLDAPVFYVSHTWGLKGVLGSQYNYHFSDFSMYKRVWLGSWGNMDTFLKGGIQWSKVPFPLLIMPAANMSYIVEDETFNLINNMEFLNDRYLSLDWSWNLQGKIFNRIPLLKKLKWREFIGVKCLWGALSDQNNPFLEENANSDYLFKFPGHYNQAGEYEYSSHVMDTKKPYVEVILGVHNIFKLLHVEYVRRLTYNELPTSNKWGLRLMIRTVF